MKTIELSEEEAQGLKEFVEAAKEIDIVECIYLMPYLSESLKKEKIDVITIRRQDALYDPNVDFSVFRARVNEQLERLIELTDGYDEEFFEGRLFFSQEDDDNYSLALMHHREIMAERQLVGGTIIFDRTGRKAENKKRAAQYVPPFSNALKISNPEILKEHGLKHS